MKKAFAFISMLCLLFGLAGYHFLYYFRMKEIKADMKMELRRQKENKDLLTFRFTAEQAGALQWEEEDEFQLDGEMFDVVEKKMVDGHLLLRCISDKKEDALIRVYLQANKNNGNKSLAFVKIFSADCILDHFDETVRRSEKGNSSFPCFRASLMHTNLSIPLPPPKIG